MSDETPRELTDRLKFLRDSMDEALAINYADSHAADVSTDNDRDAHRIDAMFEQAREVAANRQSSREALAARLTEDVLNLARMTQREAFEHAHSDHRREGNKAMRQVLLDALTGAGEETP